MKTVMVMGVLLLGVPAAHAQGQTSSPRDERRLTIGVFMGGARASDSTQGTADTRFPDGEPFLLASGRPSRRVSSWQFGDGTALLNTTLDRFTDISGIVFPHVVPLDAAVGTAVAARRNGLTGGLRLGRRLHDRVEIEVTLERRQTPLDFTDTFTGALDRTSESFRAAFQTWLSTSPLTNLQVSSAWRVSGTSAAQTRLTGAVRVTAWTRGGFTSHLSLGGGADRYSEDTPTAVLRGTYAGLMPGNAPLEEIDEVTIRIRQPRVVAVGTLGAGAAWDRRGAFGLRVDATVSWSGGARDVTVEAAPSRRLNGSPGVMPTLTSPAIQFSTAPGQPTSLSGPPVQQTTFRGRGLHREVSITAGVFRRF